ncbi:MAG: DUF1570 domain-containing protein [Planctomycetes bacterium]|nr:DUF1570 domain-containing protein [Planctomycetota bacterium]
MTLFSRLAACPVRIRLRRLAGIAAAGCLALALAGDRPSRGVDHFTIVRDGTTHEVRGRTITEAEDGGVIVLAPDGRLWIAQPDEISERRSDESPFKPFTRAEMEAALSREFPGFKIHTTANYLICHNTSKEYAQWCGALFERLHRGFHTYWSQRRFGLRPLETPMVAVMFNSHESYALHVKDEIGEAADSVVAYYSQASNRINVYDLTGIEEFKRGRKGVPRTRVNEILSQPEAARQVATIVHEATHQLCYNTGLLNRLADNPLWVSEGLAVFFETPDLKSTTGWGSIGQVNQHRLDQLRNYFPSRPGDALWNLIRDDDRLKLPASRLDAYAESWAMNYYLLKARQADYVSYLKLLSQKQAGVADSPEERIEEFRSVFGELANFDRDFRRYVDSIR